MKLHVQTTGHGPPLVMIHGWGLHGGIWQGIVADLSENWTVTIVDLPGHGMSLMPDEGFKLESLAEEILKVIPPVTAILGWSLGGMIAMRIAADHPERIDKLITIASTPRFTRSNDWPCAMEPQTLSDFATQLAGQYHTTLMQFLALQVRGSKDEKNTLRKLQEMVLSRKEPDPRALQNGLEILAKSDIRDLLTNIRCPTLLIHGEHDRLIPPEAGNAVVRLLSEAKLQVIRHAGHAPFLSHPNEFLQAVSGFLHDNIQ